MIDKERNHVYIITVNFFIKNGEGDMKRQSMTFTSNHSVHTDKFRAFSDDKIKNIKGFMFFDEDKADQHTVPLTHFCK